MFFNSLQDTFPPPLDVEKKSRTSPLDVEKKSDPSPLDVGSTFPRIKKHPS